MSYGTFGTMITVFIIAMVMMATGKWRDGDKYDRKTSGPSIS